MGQIKKIFTISLVALLLLFSFPVSAAELYHIQLEQIDSTPPKIVTYFNLLDSSDKPNADISLKAEDIDISLGTETLDIVSVSKQEASGCGVVYYYLLDVSGSVPSSTFSNVKSGIVQHLNTKSASDKIVLIAFGSSVDVILDGSESAEEAAAKVGEITANSPKTRLYDAITKTLDLVKATQSKISDRSVVFLFTDGYDVYVGGNTESEVMGNLEKSDLPIFAFGYSSGQKSYLDALGELARKSSGTFTSVNAGNAETSITAAITHINNTYRVECKTKNNNIASTSGQLTINVKSGGELYTVSGVAYFENWIPDDSSPTIKSASVESENKLVISFSEDVEGAENIDNYSLVHGKSHDVTIESVFYDTYAMTSTVVTAEKLYSGDYSLSLSNVKDTSREHNSLSESAYTFTSELVKKDLGFVLDRYLFLVIGIPAVVLVLLAVRFIVVKKKKKAEIDKASSLSKARESVYLDKVDGLPVEMSIVDANHIERKLKTVIGGCYLVGRSKDLCELGIEDKQLSRQHCVLSYENNVLTIQDLKSTNGTIVNGVPVNSVRSLSSGDMIEIGNTKLVVRF